jgi:hypothetical protein
MTARRTSAALTLSVGIALAIAACGGNAATSAPGAATEGPATEAPATEAPGSSEVPGVSFALPSFHSNADLEKMIPPQIGGEAVTTQSMSGAQFLGTPNNEFSNVLSGLGKQPSDLSVAFGFNTQVSVIAFQISGVPGSTILDAFKNSSTDVGTLTDASYGGKSVKKVTPTDTSQAASYIYTTQDVVFVVGGTASAPSDALLNEAFSKLP